MPDGPPPISSCRPALPREGAPPPRWLLAQARLGGRCPRGMALPRVEIRCPSGTAFLPTKDPGECWWFDKLTTTPLGRAHHPGPGPHHQETSGLSPRLHWRRACRVLSCVEPRPRGEIETSLPWTESRPQEEKNEYGLVILVRPKSRNPTWLKPQPERTGQATQVAQMERPLSCRAWSGRRRSLTWGREK
jgi:hypothetical protein